MPDTMSIPANLQTPNMLTAQQISDQISNQMDALNDNYNTYKAEYIKLQNLQEDEDLKGIKGKIASCPLGDICALYRPSLRTLKTKEIDI
ncbi:hypothetical protein BASA61_005101 [Batrachochytrium salamandrivorans]|nr:hypothetical protein BASA61_005101 [Batrachochytrium salamandrivorans]